MHSISPDDCQNGNTADKFMNLQKIFWKDIVDREEKVALILNIQRYTGKCSASFER